MNFFWGASGHVLLDRDADGHLTVTDEFLKAYLARPELAPPREACANERALHGKLMAAPRADVGAPEIAGIADADARENWQVFLDFRARLMAAPSLEAACLALVRGGVGTMPPLFLDQMVQIILRNVLDGEEDALVVRAAEMFFRPQRVTLQGGAVLLADEATIADHEADRHASPLLAMLGGDAVTAIDVLKPGNADAYWDRSDLHDMVFEFGGEIDGKSGANSGAKPGAKPGGRAALAIVLTAWIRHMLGLAVTITPIARIEDADWRWFVGLDQESTQLGNALWQGDTLEPEALARVLALFRLDATDQTSFEPGLAGKPVYLILAMDRDNKLRMKPQNLLTGLPLAKRA